MYTTIENLTPDQAKAKLHYIQVRLWQEQYSQNWMIEDLRPEVLLRNELRAYWEGRITEIHGWSDIVGQLVDAIVTPIQDALNWLWNTMIAPGLEAVKNFFASLLSTAYGCLGWIWDKIQAAYNYLAGTVTSFLTTLSSTLGSVWEYITKTITSVINSISQVAGATWKYLTETIGDVLTKVYTGIQGVAGYIGGAVMGGISAVGDSLGRVWDYIVTSVSGALESITKGLMALPEFIASAFQSAISYVADLISGVGQDIVKFFTWLGESTYNTIMGAINWIWESLTGMFTSFWNTMIQMGSSVKHAIEHSGPESAMTVAIPMLIGGGAITALLDIASTKILGSGLEIDGIKGFVNNLLGIDALGAAMTGVFIGAAVRRPLEHTFNQWYRPNLPDLDAATRMYWRRKLTESQYREILAKSGYEDMYIDGYMALSEVIPNINDLIRFAVREAFPVTGPAEQLAEMKKWSAFQGLNEYWCDRYWTAHWQLPGFDQLREAFWRGIIDRDDFRAFILKHDYRPNPWPGHKKADQDIMFELSYELPSVRDARWMIRWGVIDEDTFITILKLRGIHPDWIERITQAEIRNMLSDERTRVVAQLRQMYIWGRVGNQVLEAKLRELYYTTMEIQLILKAVQMQRDATLLEKRIDALVLEYRYGKITIEQLGTALTDLGLADDYIQEIIAYENARTKIPVLSTPEDEVRAEGKSVAMKRFREGLTTPEDLEAELKMLGYTDAQIARYKVIATLDRDYNFAMDVISALRTAYRGGKISAAHFMSVAKEWGILDDTVTTLISIENIKRGLGLTEEAT